MKARGEEQKDACAALTSAARKAATVAASSPPPQTQTPTPTPPPPQASLLHPSQVFARADYEKFFAALRRAWLRADDLDFPPGFKDGVQAPLRLGNAHAGRTVAPVFRARHAVLANPRAGVPGGHDVEVLWVVNARAGAWESRLPAGTRDLVQGSRGVLGSPVADFPHLPQGVASPLSAEAFVLLSQQADWQLREASDRVLEFLADAQKGGGAGGRAAGRVPP